MIFSKSTIYGIRALAYLANHNYGICSLQEIAHELAIPPVFLGKIMVQLRRRRLVDSVKGIHGGYRLSTKPETISFFDVFLVLEPNPHIDQCILGTGICSPDTACSIHCRWETAKEQILGFLQRTNISQVVEDRCLLPAKASNLTT